MIYVLYPRSDPPGGAEGAAELAYQLRGGPVFDVLAAEDLAAVPEAAPDGSAATTQPMPARYDGRHVVFAELALLVEHRQIVETVCVTLGIPLIVDVHFPLGDPDALLAIQPGRDGETREPALDEAAAEFWSDPDRLDAAWEVLSDASAIITPRDDWAFALSAFTGSAGYIDPRIWVVPDVTSPATGAAFFRKLMRAAQDATDTRGWRAVVIRILSASAARSMRKALETSDVDWSARG